MLFYQEEFVMGGKKILFISICILVLIGFACSAPANIAEKLGGSSYKLSEITFCRDVTDGGKCIEAGTSFPAGTELVYAFFTYQNMKDGQQWSRIWLQDGDLYSESLDEAWEDGAEGWVAYSLEDPNGLSGEFTLSILLEDKEVQKASFVVETAGPDDPSGGAGGSTGFPAFGPITMAEAASESAFPIGAAKSFVYGITEVVAVFPYSNMSPDLTYTAEWVKDGEELARVDYQWEDTAAGMHYTSLTDEEPLPAGKYLLNLYLGDEFVRKAEFEIVGEPTPAPEDSSPDSSKQRPNRPATPEEVVDSEALPYFYMIYNADLPVLHTVANDNLAGWTTVEVVDENPCSPDAVACFRSSCDQRWGGTVYLTRSRIQSKPDYEVTQDLIHELTHGMEHYGGMKCGCSVQKEFYAFAAELDYLWYSGHQDVMTGDYAGLWDENGRVDTGKLWDTIKEGYGDSCPDY
jgi:hypothetical protein